MNLLEQPTIDNAINKEYVKNTDMQLHESGWKGPVRTAGRSKKHSIKQISYTKGEGRDKQKIDLVFILDEESLKIKTYIFPKEGGVGIDVESMRLFIKKIEEELQ